MGSLKSIKYSIFDVSVQREIGDDYELEMNILGDELTRFLYCIDWTDMT